MTSELIIKEADQTDISVIRTMAHAIWPGTYGSILSEGQLKHMLDLMYSHQSLNEQFNEGHIFLLGTLNAEVVAFASYAHGSRAGIYKIHKLYVHPMLQGKGIGRKMLDHIVNNIQQTGTTAVQLNVNRYNPAKKFYEKYGFSVIGEEDIAIGEGYFMNDFVMEKKLRSVNQVGKYDTSSNSGV